VKHAKGDVLRGKKTWFISLWCALTKHCDVPSPFVQLPHCGLEKISQNWWCEKTFLLAVNQCQGDAAEEPRHRYTGRLGINVRRLRLQLPPSMFEPIMCCRWSEWLFSEEMKFNSARSSTITVDFLHAIVNGGVSKSGRRRCLRWRASRTTNTVCMLVDCSQSTTVSISACG
jgi:hypothetical protein